jgi:hypothetical protein
MRSCLRLLLFAVVAAAAPSANAQTLWQNVTVGMSGADIQRAQPSARPPRERSTLAHGSAVCELQIQDYEVASRTFDVCFYMTGGRLVQVMLTADDPSQALFSTLADLLRARYGRELSPNSQPCRVDRLSTSCRLDWLLDSGVNVSVVFMEIGGPPGILNINYQTRIRDESERL